MLDAAQKSWHGVALDRPDWGDGSLSVALEGVLAADGLRFYLIFNAYWEPLEFTLPPPLAGQWRLVADTGASTPDDIHEPGHEPPFTASSILVGARSTVILTAG